VFYRVKSEIIFLHLHEERITFMARFDAEAYPPKAPLDPAEDLGSDFDPMGSYTGVPEDGGEPVQDADDL